MSMCYIVLMENTIPETSEPRYFRPSIAKFILLSLVTLGGYKIYWAYRNWDAIKVKDKGDLSATWQSILFIFFVRQLFRRMSHDLRGTESGAVKKGDNLAVMYIVITVGLITIRFILKNEFILETIITLFGALVNFAILIYFQLFVFKNTRVPINNRTARGEMVVVIFFALPVLVGFIRSVVGESKESDISHINTNKPLNIIIE